jgi:hypothetical protein
MNPVDPAARLAALMRSQVAALRRPAGVQQTSSSAAAKPRSGAAQQGADFASIVAQRMKTIEPNDPAREQKAIRIYLESVILAELGPSLVNDPAFSLLIEDVHAQMAGDPELARSLAQAADLLLGPAH